MLDPELAEAVRQHLPRVLASEPFRSTKRSRDFLEYIVTRVLEGREDLLKERTIGTEVFDRPPDCETAADPIVRVRATEVRKRLAQYYQTVGQDEPVRIRVPAGAYIPFSNGKTRLRKRRTILATLLLPIPSLPDTPAGRAGFSRWPVLSC